MTFREQETICRSTALAFFRLPFKHMIDPGKDGIRSEGRT